MSLPGLAHSPCCCQGAALPVPLPLIGFQRPPAGGCPQLLATASLLQPLSLSGKSNALYCVAWTRQRCYTLLPDASTPPPTSLHPLSLTRSSPGLAGGPARSPQNIPLLYFGTAEVGCLRPGALTGFEEGLARGFHGSQRKRKEQAFRRALCEVEAFLRVRTGVQQGPCLH